MQLNEKLLLGAPVAALINAETASITSPLIARGIKPTLAVVHLGVKPDDISYQRQIALVAPSAGLAVRTFSLPADADAKKILEVIEQINADAELHGVLIQTIRDFELSDQAYNALDLRKDAEGMKAVNVKLLEYNHARIVPCTASAILSLIKSVCPDLDGMDVAIVNASPVIGLPLSQLLVACGATPTLCSHHTKDLPGKTRRADVLVTATGRHKLIGRDHIKAGQVVIDASIIRTPENHIVGDVDREAVLDLVSKITPVPNGVGPVTVATLLNNVAKLCQDANSTATAAAA